MSKTLLVKHAYIVTDGKIVKGDVRINGQRFERISTNITPTPQDTVVDANGKYLLPGMIDDQVHFREPGLTHKGNIESESRAAVAGGITSFMEMPNVSPATTTIAALEQKFDIAKERSVANYSFYLGATEDNLDEIKKLNTKQHCGVKVFMGASTGDLLVEHPDALDAIFRDSPTLIVTHCESGAVIAENLAKVTANGHVPTIADHPIIRDEQACYASSSYAVSLAKKYNSNLHVLHITTAKELSLFAPGPVENKRITAEACVHHLWFSQDDYAELGNQIKCNPAIKKTSDRDAIVQALHTNQIDIIATDHAPHTWQEKQVDYNQAPAGLPLVEHALLSLFDLVHQHKLTLEQVVEKTAHNPAKRYAIENRGYIKEGYFTDFILVDLQKPTNVTHKNCRYLCKWTPFNGHEFTSSIEGTWVNGQQVFNGEDVIENTTAAQRLVFNR
ncbi:dihydroorotase [Alteromonas sp. C1M14]|uniref:dihydroorotase n=1 Tax=Alteromonas sp. C1M14 TaxID=2841567 RepID=UPI001C0945D4|nr:dihydroorotase [Alteromonas sp. C1M14]MBU2978748.1 dihydroorotase [Alteromonas sp. C1M14]